MDSKQKKENQEEEQNLGLDADHSSEAGNFKAALNNDNDMISGNPDGENDNKDDEVRNSPLDDK